MSGSLSLLEPSGSVIGLYRDWFIFVILEVQITLSKFPMYNNTINNIYTDPVVLV
jgi:hypothetical protein